jgi:glycosyltransferase involved in cell wall biosynthesis
MVGYLHSAQRFISTVVANHFLLATPGLCPPWVLYPLQRYDLLIAIPLEPLEASRGCVVVGSSCGGLPEAIVPCGKIFKNGDPSALAEVLRELLGSPGAWDKFFDGAKAHLDAHRPAVVAEKYEVIFKKASSS